MDLNIKPTVIHKVCEWTKKPFIVDWRHRNQRFINRQAMYDWRKSQNRETVNCLNCGTPFERYKRILHPRSKKLTQYCSNICNITSKEKKEKLKIWGMSDKNHWNDVSVQSKVKTTKLKKYGDEKYNNAEKSKKTCFEKYGTDCYFDSKYAIKSNGKRISKFQQKTYDLVLQNYPDALLEEYLIDTRCSVDIFIPSIKKVIECYGDYWHCNPTLCSSSYYNMSVHKTAQEIWDRDKIKVDKLISAGYTVEIIWENSNKKLKHKDKPLYL